jgi:hypothetical protein
MVRRFYAGNNVQMGLDYRDRSVAAVSIHRKETTILVRPTEEKGTAMDF